MALLGPGRMGMRPRDLVDDAGGRSAAQEKQLAGCRRIREDGRAP